MSYFTAPDGHGDDTLWRSAGPDDETPTALFTRFELDKVDPILWPTLVATLAEPSLHVQIREVCARDGKIAAIRAYREHLVDTASTVPNLRDCKAQVERICAFRAAPAQAEPRVWRVIAVPDGIDPDEIGTLYREHDGRWECWFDDEDDDDDGWYPMTWTGVAQMERYGYVLVEVTNQINEVTR